MKHEKTNPLRYIYGMRGVLDDSLDGLSLDGSFEFKPLTQVSPLKVETVLAESHLRLCAEPTSTVKCEVARDSSSRILFVLGTKQSLEDHLERLRVWAGLREPPPGSADTYFFEQFNATTPPPGQEIIAWWAPRADLLWSFSLEVIQQLQQYLG